MTAPTRTITLQEKDAIDLALHRIMAMANLVFGAMNSKTIELMKDGVAEAVTIIEDEALRAKKTLDAVWERAKGGA